MSVTSSLWQRLFDWARGHARITRTVTAEGDVTIMSRGSLTIIGADIRAGDGHDGKKGADIIIRAGVP